MKTASKIHSLSRPVHISEATINISNLRLRTYIGFNPEEREKKQDVIINIEVRYNMAAGVLDDRVEEALNYKVITKKVIAYVENGKFLLLEKLVAEVLAMWTGIPVMELAEEESDRLLHRPQRPARCGALHRQSCRSDQSLRRHQALLG